MSLVDRLQSVIVAWIGARKGRTLKQLSEETQLNYGTIKNIADAKGEPNGETVLRLLLPILPIAEVHEIVSQHFSHMAPYTKSLSELSLTVSTASSLTPKHNRAILELSFGARDLDALAMILGTGADRIIDELEEAEICRRSGSTVELTNINIHFPKQQYAHDVLNILLNHVNIAVPGNKLSVRAQALSDEGVRRAYEVMMKAEAELQAIIADRTLQGEHKFGCALLTTIL